METWGYVIAVVLGVAISELIRLFHDWQERHEKYRLMIYEKRLEAHQEAFYWVRELNRLFTGSMADMDQDRVDKIKEIINKVDTWWGSHCFYLDDKSSDSVLEVMTRSEELIGAYGDFVLPYRSNAEPDREQYEKWKKERWQLTVFIDRTWRTLEKGIGMKHIEEPKRQAKAD